MTKTDVQINHVMLKDLCKDAGWRCEETRDGIMVYHRIWGGEYDLK